MIDNSDIIADFHIHTIGSLHACSTLKECIDSAEAIGMKYIAITDHYYNDGTDICKKNEVNRFYFLEERANKTRANVIVIGGAEFNIGQNIEYWKKLQTLKWKMIGVHGWFIDRSELTLDQLLAHYKECVGKFEAFSHIEREIDKIEYGKYGNNLTDDVKGFLDQIVRLAKNNGTILEVDESSLSSNKHGEYQKIRYWLSRAKKEKIIVSLGSDAHYCEEIGVFDNSLKLLNEIDFPINQILNCNEELIRTRFEL